MARVIETRTEELTLGDDGVLRCRIKPTDAHTLEDAVENVRARLSLIGERRVPTLLDARATGAISRQAREYYTGPETARMTPSHLTSLISTSAVTCGP